MDGTQSLLQLFGSESPDPIAAMNQILIHALDGEKIEVKISSPQTLNVAIDGGVEQGWEINGIVGAFRAALGRLGYVFSETANSALGPSNLLGVGRLADLKNLNLSPNSEWAIVRGSFLPNPGSPFYNVQGELVFRNRSGFEKRIKVAMENTGVSQWCSMSGV